MTFWLWLGFVWLLIWVSRLSSKVQSLEEQFAEKKTPAKAAKSEKSADLPWETEPDTPKPIKRKAKQSEFGWEDFLGRKFFSLLGVVSIVLAIGFFTVWAFANGYIGPQGQIAIGILASLGFLMAGELMRARYPKFFPLLSSVGIAGLLITTYVSANVYDFLTVQQSFFAYIIEVAVGLTLSLRYNARVLGNFAVLGGLLAPLLLHNEPPEPLHLLTFLAILSVAGFIVSSRQRWPELLVLLFVGITGFECTLLNRDPLPLSPSVFLAFVFGMHVLLGSGGIVRCVREKVQQKLHAELEGQSVLEIVLLVFSVLVANFIASEVFQNQGWEYFGFFVLAQGFAFFALAEWVKKHGLLLFHKLCLGATLVSILFATGWEIGIAEPFALSLAFVAEGILLSLAAKESKEPTFLLFGAMALLLSFVVFFGIDPFWQATVATVALMGGLLYSSGGTPTSWSNLWSITVMVLCSVLVWHWSFELLDTALGRLYGHDYLLWIAPVIWGVGLSYSTVWHGHTTTRLVGLLFVSLLHIMWWTKGGLSSYYLFPLEAPFGLALLLAGSFTVLATYFWADPKLRPPVEQQAQATILTLSLTSISVLLWAMADFDEPLTSLIWVAWGALLLTLGIQKTWPHFRYGGIAVLCLLIAKIYLFDIWDWETWVKFVALFGLGAGLLAISFGYQKSLPKK